MKSFFVLLSIATLSTNVHAVDLLEGIYIKGKAALQIHTCLEDGDKLSGTSTTNISCRKKLVDSETRCLLTDIKDLKTSKGLLKFSGQAALQIHTCLEAGKAILSVTRTANISCEQKLVTSGFQTDEYSITECSLKD